jgi:hypothetical protein
MAFRLQVKHQKMRVEQRAQIPNRMLPGFPEPEFVILLRSPGIDSQHGGQERQPYLTYRPAIEYIGWRNRFLGSLIQKRGLDIYNIKQ